jgi:hypothetical protein
MVFFGVPTVCIFVYACDSSCYPEEKVTRRVENGK